jgi:hypothetical protein
MVSDEPIEFRLPPVLASSVDVEVRITLKPFNNVELEELLEAIGL